MFLVHLIFLSFLHSSYCMVRSSDCSTYEIIAMPANYSCETVNGCFTLSAIKAVNDQTYNCFCYENQIDTYAFSHCNEQIDWKIYQNGIVPVILVTTQNDNLDCSSKPCTNCLSDFLDACKSDTPCACFPDDETTTSAPDSTTTTSTMLPTTTEEVQTTTADSSTECDLSGDQCGCSYFEDTTSKTSRFENEREILMNSTASDEDEGDQCVSGHCPHGECFFENHCYSIVKFNHTEGYSAQTALSMCSESRSLARGVAIESEDEKVFVTNLVMRSLISRTGNGSLFLLTSGGPKVWKGWSTLVNTSLMGICQSQVLNQKAVLAAKVSPRGVRWVYLEDEIFGVEGVICEREFVWSAALPARGAFCEDHYRDCDGSFCCAADKEQILWFQCGTLGTAVATQPCSFDPENLKTWSCSDGNFEFEAPNTSACVCSRGCRTMYNGKLFSACSGQFAYSPCPNKQGYQRWLCLENGTFQGTSPSEDLCCNPSSLCRGQDSFLNVWLACPNKTAVRYTECPNGLGQKANVSWRCGELGFEGLTPDYSECQDCVNPCKAEDWLGNLWLGCRGQNVYRPCPDKLFGSANWTCDNTSQFINPGPDNSHCHPQWVDTVHNKISNGEDAVGVMLFIHQKMENDFPGAGLREVVKVTTQCVHLFFNQNTGNATISLFENFTQLYGFVLGDIINNDSAWTTLLPAVQERLLLDVIDITEELALSLPLLTEAADAGIQAGYNNSFLSKHNETSIWVAYSNVTDVPLHLVSGSGNCTLNLIHHNLPSNSTEPLFGTVALAIPPSIASSAFPVLGSGKDAMNSVMLSVTVGDMRSTGGWDRVTNLSIQVSFSHLTRARHPPYTVINRRLHTGEQPSPIIYSSRCLFYQTETTPGYWSQKGCEVMTSSDSETSCRCNHLSSFAVLVDFHEYVPDPILEVFSIVCSALSMLSLVLTLIVFNALRKRKIKIDSDRTLIGINCCLCLLIAHGLIVTVLDRKFFNLSDSMCCVVAGVLHYVLLSAFLWMSVEAFHLYDLIVLVFMKERSYRSHYFIVGYIFPLIPIMLTELASQVLEKPAYGRDELCWLQTGFIWSFNGPVFFLTAINLVVIVIAMRSAITKKDSVSFKTWWIWCKGLLSLSTLLGVTWLVAVAYFDLNLPHSFDYFFVLLNGLQGVYIFIFQCVLSSHVRPFLRSIGLYRKTGRRQSLSRKTTIRSGDLSAKTGSSSVECGSNEGVQVVRTPSDGSGQWLFKAQTPRRSCDGERSSAADMVRNFRNRIIVSRLNSRMSDAHTVKI